MVAPTVRLRVWKIVDAVRSMDDPFLASHIPGQACVPPDVLVPRHHPVARPEPGPGGLPRPLRQTLHLRENRGGERRIVPARRLRHPPRLLPELVEHRVDLVCRLLLEKKTETQPSSHDL